MAFYRSGGGSLTETVLWTNLTPTSAFATQTVSLNDNLSNYDYVAFEVKAATDTQDTFRVIYPIEVFQNSKLNVSKSYIVDFGGTAINGQGYVRCAFYDTDTTIKFDDSYKVNVAGKLNTSNIPLKVIGLK